MDPVSTYFESKNQIALKQMEVLGEMDLRSLLSELGGSGGGKSKGTSNQAEQAPVEEEVVNKNL